MRHETTSSHKAKQILEIYRSRRARRLSLRELLEAETPGTGGCEEVVEGLAELIERGDLRPAGSANYVLTPEAWERIAATTPPSQSGAEDSQSGNSRAGRRKSARR